MHRRAEFRPFSWLHDLWKRDQLDLSPPYQRRSVWPDRFRSDFVTTVLLNYPCPAIFLFEEIRDDGTFFYKVVDGKQRLTTLFDFVSDRLPIADDYPSPALRDKLFDTLDSETKLSVWRYAFSVEFIEQENASLINSIFNRINKNVAKLSQQELRHALFSGRFITAVDYMTDYISEKLPPNFPNIAAQSRRQMKDVENTATLALFIENGTRSTSQSDLDEAFRDRDETWPDESSVKAKFVEAIDYIANILGESPNFSIASSRLRNQADFYSLFGAIVELRSSSTLPSPLDAARRLSVWLLTLKDVERSPLKSDTNAREVRYLDAARAASNDSGPRRVRIDIVKDVLLGN